MDSYTLDPYLITLEEFYRLTTNKQLIPSRIQLNERIEERFSAIEKTGIRHLGMLIKILGSKQDIAAFSAKTGIPAAYLTLLKREAGSYLARPFSLSDFPGVPYEYTEALKTLGIKHTRDFFERFQNEEEKKETAGKTGIPLARLNEIFSLTDLSRITGVGGVFARVVYQAGITSVRAFAQTDAKEHYRAYLAVIEKHGYAAGYFSAEDIQYCIDYAQVICLTLDKRIVESKLREGKGKK